MLDLTKTYRTREGNPARFLAEINNKSFPLIFAIAYPDGEEVVQTFTPEGGYYSSNDISQDDLVEYNPWVNLPVDTPIFVRSNESDVWVPRYFSHLDALGKVRTFANGRTSFSAEGLGEISWNYAKLKD